MEKLRITIPQGTELNHGTHEDSDLLTLTRDVEAEVVGEITNGALPVKILDQNGHPLEPALHYHQPVLLNISFGPAPLPTK